MPATDRPGADLLAGRTALIAGGTGNVGRYLVGGLLDVGATVIVPSRSRERLERLWASIGPGRGDRLITIEGDIGEEQQAARLLDEVVSRAGPLDAAVASLGRFVPAPSVLSAPLSDLEQVLDGYLVAHFVVARTVIPALEKTGGSYTFINGPLAFEPMFPGTGLVSIATAAQAMLARTVMKESQGAPLRVNEVVLYTSFGWGDDDRKANPVRHEDVGRYVAYLISDRGAAVRGRTIHLDSLEPLRALASA
jgi:NAD(P)-dependent dehydrogenase (short-subunit alcohol dehydrogenase family)